MARGGSTAPLSTNASLRWPLIKEAMLRARPSRTLEIGCGQGAMATRLAALTAELTVAERDPTSRVAAEARLAPMGVGVRSEVPRPGEEEPFDVVCAFEVLEHLEDDVAALREWAALLRPGGFVLLSVPAWQAQYGAWDRKAGHFRRYDPDALRARFDDAGLDTISVDLYGWPIGYVLQWAMNLVAAREAARHRDGTPASMEARTAGSGRMLQPAGRVGGLVRAAVSAPFQVTQRLVRSHGTGLVALATRRPGRSSGPLTTTQ